jgi:hypothetical protein
MCGANAALTVIIERRARREDAMTDIPVRIAFHGLAVKETLEADIRRRIDRLRALHPRLTSCDVVIEVPHRHHQRGRHVRVRLELSIGDGVPVIVSHEPAAPAHHLETEGSATKKDEGERAHRHARLAIHDAFETARRELRDRLGTEHVAIAASKR